MADPVDIFHQSVQAAPAVKPAVRHVIHHAVAAAPVIKQGFSMLTLVISNAVTAGIMFGLGWYIRGRGLTGVANDINNIKTDVENLKAKVFPSTSTTTVAAS